MAHTGFGSDVPLQQYRALRRMHAHSERMSHEGWLDAWTEFDGRGFRYQIVAERGSDTVRNKVLKALLKREQELIATGDFGRGELTAENYEFGPETTSDGLRYVTITPRRRDVMLVDGRMVLDRAGELLRVEGLLARNPSFWTTQVNVVRHYARVDGTRVPVSTESIARVRFVGLSRLNISYEYETINHRDVRTAALNAPAGISRVSGR
ncbi:MAG TPA: hypothetical protein VM364_07235 [Vicinamibacterales bacterium]|nr:hypothetical protein [Vicinamibacterales bacterium]